MTISRVLSWGPRGRGKFDHKSSAVFHGLWLEDAGDVLWLALRAAVWLSERKGRQEWGYCWGGERERERERGGGGGRREMH